MKRTIFWIAIFLGAIWLWKNDRTVYQYILDNNLVSRNQTELHPESQPEDLPFSLSVSDDLPEAAPVTINYNAPVELDGMSLERIMSLRRQKVMQHKELIN